MNWNELLNPWAALRRAKLEIEVLKRQQVLLAQGLKRDIEVLRREKEMLVQELRKAQRNDNRGKDGKFKKGDK